MTIAELTDKIRAFRDARDWAQFHKPNDMAAAVAIEAAELQEHFLWKTHEESAEHLVRHGDEVAEQRRWPTSPFTSCSWPTMPGSTLAKRSRPSSRSMRSATPPTRLGAGTTNTPTTSNPTEPLPTGFQLRVRSTWASSIVPFSNLPDASIWKTCLTSFQSRGVVVYLASAFSCPANCISRLASWTSVPKSLQIHQPFLFHQLPRNFPPKSSRFRPVLSQTGKQEDFSTFGLQPRWSSEPSQSRLHRQKNENAHKRSQSMRRTAPG